MGRPSENRTGAHRVFSASGGLLSVGSAHPQLGKGAPVCLRCAFVPHTEGLMGAGAVSSPAMCGGTWC